MNHLSQLEHVFYINLHYRADRREHVERELASIGVSNATRFEAIVKNNGAVGCTLSHLSLLNQAIANNWDHVLIVEDDITFLQPALFQAQMNAFLQRHAGEWDVVLLAGNNIPPCLPVDDTCVQVQHCQTTTGYLVNGPYLQTLANNVREGLLGLMRTQNRPLYAIDRFWFSLQKKHRWFLIVPLTVVQREDYSDIEKRVTNYGKMMRSLT